MWTRIKAETVSKNLFKTLFSHISESESTRARTHTTKRWVSHNKYITAPQRIPSWIARHKSCRIREKQEVGDWLHLSCSCLDLFDCWILGLILVFLSRWKNSSKRFVNDFYKTLDSVIQQTEWIMGWNETSPAALHSCSLASGQQASSVEVSRG